MVSRMKPWSGMSKCKPCIIFRSDDIDGMILGRLSDKEKRRQEIIFELLQTERDYVRDLDIIIELFLNGLRDSKILSAKDITTMFSNIESLLPINQVRLV